jgi:hypothetical protein
METGTLNITPAAIRSIVMIVFIVIGTTLRTIKTVFMASSDVPGSPI